MFQPTLKALPTALLSTSAKVAVPAASLTVTSCTVRLARLTVSATLSLSMMVALPPALDSVALTAPDSVSLKPSAVSTSLSSTSATRTTWLVTPGANTSVPLSEA